MFLGSYTFVIMAFLFMFDHSNQLVSGFFFIFKGLPRSVISPANRVRIFSKTRRPSRVVSGDVRNLTGRVWCP